MSEYEQPSSGKEKAKTVIYSMPINGHPDTNDQPPETAYAGTGFYLLDSAGGLRLYALADDPDLVCIAGDLPDWANTRKWEHIGTLYLNAQALATEGFAGDYPGPRYMGLTFERAEGGGEALQWWRDVSDGTAA